MKTGWLVFLLIFGTNVPTYAAIQHKKMPEFYVYNTQKSEQLQTGTAQLIIYFRSQSFQNIPSGYETVVYYSINGITDTLFLDSSFSQILQLKSGKTTFKFWAGPGYQEIISDSIDIQSQTTNEAIAFFHTDYQPINVDKPVIYFQSPLIHDFTLEVIPNGSLSFTYPAYDNAWKGTVHPNGTIDIKGKTYPYLFWDSKQQFHFQKTNNGYYVEKKEVLSFLEEQLSNLGLSASEKADFITFWGSKMIRYESVFIQFYLQESCDRFATLHCDPKPEQVNRVYIAFSKWDESFRTYLNPTKQTPFIRTGFNLLEWGGFEFKFPGI